MHPSPAGPVLCWLITRAFLELIQANEALGGNVLLFLESFGSSTEACW